MLPGMSPEVVEGLKQQLTKSQEQLQALLGAFERLQASGAEQSVTLEAEKRSHEQTSIELQACRALLAKSAEGAAPATAGAADASASSLAEQLTACRVELDVAHEVERTLTEHYAKTLRDNSVLEQRVKELEAELEALRSAPLPVPPAPPAEEP